MTRVQQIKVWLALPIASSTWRHEARETMRSIVRQHWTGATDKAHMSALLALVDEEYPFGERRMHPYKVWLEERSKLKDALGLGMQLLPPTDEDAAACDVARDLVELGRIDEAKTLLDEQAPRRLNVACPACGVIAGKQCRDPYEKAEMPPDFMQRPWYLDGEDRWVIDRIVPHESRVRVVHGPLFGSAR